MIKCPHCGSTAQPKNETVTVSDNGRYFCETYECGCGCGFEALFPREEVEEYFIHYLKKQSVGGFEKC